MTETPSAATFTTGYDESATALWCWRRTGAPTASSLDALITQQPDSDLIPKVVTGLIGNQRAGGHWSNVQENGFILLAMKRYFDTFESTTPDFVARVWLGDTYTAEHAAPRALDRHGPHSRADGPSSAAIPTSSCGKDGPGRLYYRLGLRYAPSRPAPRPPGRGIRRGAHLRGGRRTTATSSADDDGSWTHRRRAPWSGSGCRWSPTPPAPTWRWSTTSPPASRPSTRRSPPHPRPPAEEEGDEARPAHLVRGYTWFDHQNFRDDRTEAYSAYLPAGTYEYTYVARATTPGTFVAPPAKAEEIYAPEVFGRSGTDRVTVG